MDARLPISQTVARVNGVALHRPGEALDAESLHERACTELLRQEAIRLGLLPASALTLSPEPDQALQVILSCLLEQQVHSPSADLQACQRHYQAHPARYTQGQKLQLRHVLFAVTPGVDVQALSRLAEQALFEIKQSPDQFAAIAAQRSNCPSGARGGDLGWLTPQDCAPELIQALFQTPAGLLPVGLHPRLIHSRYGLHIVQVLEREEGRLQPFEAVHERIATQLNLQSRARALNQYLMLLAGRAQIEGVTLAAAATALVQ